MIFFYTFSNSSIRLTIILNTYIYEIHITSFKLYTYKVHIFALKDDCKSHFEIALDVKCNLSLAEGGGKGFFNHLLFFNLLIFIFNSFIIYIFILIFILLLQDKQ